MALIRKSSRLSRNLLDTNYTNFINGKGADLKTLDVVVEDVALIAAGAKVIDESSLRLNTSYKPNRYSSIMGISFRT
jgi:hypothetical protein